MPMHILEMVVVVLGLLFFALAVLLTSGPQTLANMVVYPVAGVALVLAFAFAWEHLDKARRRFRRWCVARRNEAKDANRLAPGLQRWLANMRGRLASGPKPETKRWSRTRPSAGFARSADHLGDRRSGGRERD